ncbi:MAG: PilN domain-containing protein [Deltaproteobacteria bacterium]|nr:MAG: PilN domain-containing protein [Deltaproteobacteria bacterium]
MALEEINLIPEDILARRQMRRHLFFWLGCLFISLGLIWGFYFYQSYLLTAKKRRVTALKDMHTSLGAKIDEIRRMQEELNRLRQQQNLLENMTASEPYSHICAKLADLVNESTWLTNLTIDNGKQGEAETNLKLTGFSFSNDELGNFLNRLSLDPMFKAVVLKLATESEMAHWNRNVEGSVKLIQFHIECSLARV